ncbi:MAG: hypothetical protein DRP78_02130 [Candidatus Omnitrophota bacterium]|nr:MAG: hypothetical protein DRP78_02130 [Candidatus Omnitrophota bacterium]
MNFYQQNISTLKKYHPKIAEKVETVSADYCQDIIYAKNGQPTLKINNKFLHSFYDPIKEAQDFIAQQEIGDKDNLFIFGFGFGYHILELLRKNILFNYLIIVEPDLKLFVTALKVCDLRPVLRIERLRFFIDVSPLDIYACLTRSSLLLLSAKSAFVELNSAILLNRSYFEDLRKRILDSIRTDAFSMHTLTKYRRLFIYNASLNFTEAMNSAGVKTLFDKFKNMPAIIVSAGPSLDKNVDLLHSVKGKALILSTDTAFKILLAHNIKPDLVFTADLYEKSRLHFEDVSVTDVPVVFMMDSSYTCLQTYQGPRFVCACAGPFTEWIHRMIGDKGVISKGMCVAHFVFFAAEKFGCDPVIFIGQDLSFPGGFTHARGTGSRVPVEGYERTTLPVQSSITGETLLTDPQMYVYLQAFEKMVKNSKRLCINATQGGVGIKGTKVMYLQDVISQYCGLEIPISNIIEQACLETDTPDLNHIKEQVKELQVKVLNLHSASSEIINILAQIFKLSEKEDVDKKNISLLLAKLKEPARIIRGEEYILQILHTGVFKELMQMERESEVNMEFSKGKKINDLEKDFSEDLVFQKSINLEAVFLNQCLEKILEKLAQEKSPVTNIKNIK